MDALRIYFYIKTLTKKNIDCYSSGGELELSQTNLIHKMLSFVVLFCTNLFPVEVPRKVVITYII